MSEPLPPFVELSHFEIDPASVRLLALGYCEKKHVVVLGRVDPEGNDPVTVAMIDPGDAQLRGALQSFLGRPVAPVRLSAWEIQRALDIGHGRLDPTADPGRIVLQEDDALAYEPGHPAPAMALELVSRAVGLGAREIHVERGAEGVDVRVRIDGVLHSLGSALTPDDVQPVVGYLATLAGIAEGDAPRSGTIRATLGSDTGGRPLDLRLSLLPGPHGTDATIHVLVHGGPARSLPELGLAPDRYAAVALALRAGEGLVLVAAPQGHGRTSMLHALLGALEPGARKIMSVEMPALRVLPNIVQRSAPDPAAAAELARACLQHAPDVLALDEVASPAIAEVAATAIERGVLVVAVVTARDVSAGLVALRRMGIADGELCDALVLAMSPRLLPRLCPACRRPAPDDPLAAAFAASGRAIRAHVAPGCASCRALGHAGRIAAIEVVVPEAAFVRALESGAPASELRGVLTMGGSPTHLDLAAALADAGEVALGPVQALAGASLTRAHGPTH